MQSAKAGKFDCYQHSKVRCLHCDDSWIVRHAACGCGYGSEPSVRIRVNHYRKDEMLVGHSNVSDGQPAFPVKEKARHTQSLFYLPSHLFAVCRTSELFFKDKPNVTKYFELPWYPLF